MAQRHEVEAWVNPSAWDDEDQAARVVDAIMEDGSDGEADWVRIAGEVAGEDVTLVEIEAAARDFTHAEALTGQSWERLRELVREAYAAGKSPTSLAGAAGVSRMTVHKWTADLPRQRNRA